MSEETIRMNCIQFEEILNDLDRPGMPEGALRESALAHAESCGPCARLLTETESLDFALQALGEQESDRHAPAHVEAALLQAFRHEKKAAMRPRIWWQLSALAAAAVVLLALGVSLRQHWVPGFNPGGITAGVTPLAAKPAAVSSDTSASEYASGFVALPYADDAANVEGSLGGARVALSRSALASLGVPVADATDTNEVPADLIVSLDGTPQAIRLVSEVTAN